MFISVEVLLCYPGLAMLSGHSPSVADLSASLVTSSLGCSWDSPVVTGRVNKLAWFKQHQNNDRILSGPPDLGLKLSLAIFDPQMK